MPELPEVETIRTQLETFLPFKVSEVLFSSVSGSIVKEQAFSCEGMTIERIERKGKMLKFCLSGNKYILSHLGMSGGWRIKKEFIEEKHTHVQFVGRVGRKKFHLGYVDPRRFGNMYFVDELRSIEKENALGVDISSTDFDWKYLFNVLQKYPNKIIKPFLLDQTKFSGIGNYIACELLALGGVLPERTSGSISKNECKKLVKATKDVIFGQIKAKGLTFSGGYTDATGSKGEGLNSLVVFHQEVCGICNKNFVTKVVLGGRGTYYCSRCQK